MYESAAFVSMVDLLVFTGQVSVLRNDFLTFSVITIFNSILVTQRQITTVASRHFIL